MDKVRLGVIGLGNQGKNYLNAYAKGDLPEIEVTAVADIDSRKFERALSIIPGVPCFGTGEELIKSGLCDAVAIATPHYFHPSFVITALENGLHALSEKPAGVYTKQVREAIEASEKSDKTYAMMFNVRPRPEYQLLRKIVSGGEYGEMIRVNWIVTSWFRTQAYYDSGTWRATWEGEGGGVLLNQAPHQLDLWQWICGMPSKIRAFCREGSRHNIEVEDDVTIYAEYPNGATGTFITSTGEYPGSNRLEITLEKARILCEADPETGKTVLKIAELDIPLDKFTRSSDGGFDKPSMVWKDIEIEPAEKPFEQVLNAFAAHILRGEPLIAEGPEGINGLMISNAAFLSSWLDKTIELPVDEDLFLEKLNEKIKNSTYEKKLNENVKIDMAKSYQ